MRTADRRAPGDGRARGAADVLRSDHRHRLRAVPAGGCRRRRARSRARRPARRHQRRRPVAAAITSIDFDHEQYLGHTLAAIAAEKAGIIRPGIPVVVGPLAAEARDVVVSACAASRRRLRRSRRATFASNRRARMAARPCTLTTPVRDYGWVPLGLRGEHQVPNALVAVRLLEQLERHCPDRPPTRFGRASRRAMAGAPADDRSARRPPRAARRRAQSRRGMGARELPAARVSGAASDRLRRDARQGRRAHAEDAPPRRVDDGDDRAGERPRALRGRARRDRRAGSRRRPRSRSSPTRRRRWSARGRTARSCARPGRSFSSATCSARLGSIGPRNS